MALELKKGTTSYTLSEKVYARENGDIFILSTVSKAPLKTPLTGVFIC